MNKIDPLFWEDLRWGERHHGELLQKYSDLWVAIHNKKVIASGVDGKKVRDVAKQKTGVEQIPLLFVDCGRHIYGQG